MKCIDQNRSLLVGMTENNWISECKNTINLYQKRTIVYLSRFSQSVTNRRKKYDRYNPSFKRNSLAVQNWLKFRAQFFSYFSFQTSFCQWIYQCKLFWPICVLPSPKQTNWQKSMNYSKNWEMSKELVGSFIEDGIIDLFHNRNIEHCCRSAIHCTTIEIYIDFMYFLRR